jgi:hypothetical protein
MQPQKHGHQMIWPLSCLVNLGLSFVNKLHHHTRRKLFLHKPRFCNIQPRCSLLSETRFILHYCLPMQFSFSVSTAIFSLHAANNYLYNSHLGSYMSYYWYKVALATEFSVLRTTLVRWHAILLKETDHIMTKTCCN